MSSTAATKKASSGAAATSSNNGLKGKISADKLALQRNSSSSSSSSIANPTMDTKSDESNGTDGTKAAKVLSKRPRTELEEIAVPVSTEGDISGDHFIELALDSSGGKLETKQVSTDHVLRLLFELVHQQKEELIATRSLLERETRQIQGFQTIFQAQLQTISREMNELKSSVSDLRDAIHSLPASKTPDSPSSDSSASSSGASVSLPERISSDEDSRSALQMKTSSESDRNVASRSIANATMTSKNDKPIQKDQSHPPLSAKSEVKNGVQPNPVGPRSLPEATSSAKNMEGSSGQGTASNVPAQTSLPSKAVEKSEGKGTASRSSAPATSSTTDIEKGNGNSKTISQPSVATRDIGKNNGERLASRTVLLLSENDNKSDEHDATSQGSVDDDIEDFLNKL